MQKRAPRGLALPGEAAGQRKVKALHPKVFAKHGPKFLRRKAAPEPELSVTGHQTLRQHLPGRGHVLHSLNYQPKLLDPQEGAAAHGDAKL